ncbi:unnamed protein product, partial [Linum tenue]
FRFICFESIQIIWGNQIIRIDSLQMTETMNQMISFMN